MKKEKCILIWVLSFVTLTTTFGGNPNSEKFQFTKQDASIAMSAFNDQFYNKDMKLFYTTSDKKGRAAIWTQAIYWDMVMNAYKRTKDKKYLQQIEDVYQGGYEQYDKYNWNNTDEWFVYDDLMWWIISLARAYEITGDKKYLDHSIAGFDRVWDGIPGVDDRGSYDKEAGGMRWGWKRDEWTGKMACINYPTVVAAATLYNITKNKAYLDKATEIYEWSRNNLFDKKTGAVADSKHGTGDAHWRMHVYNQATCIGGAVMLYKITKDEHYKNDAILAADYTKNVMSDEDGILPFRTGIEQGVYTAIFSQYIIRLAEDCKQPQYLDWMRLNINKAWQNRDKTRNLTFKDFNNPCPEGVIEVYDASACPALMQVIPPSKK